MKKLLLGFVAVVAAAYVAWRVVDGMRSDADRVRQVVDACLDAGRARSASGILRHVAGDFSAPGLAGAPGLDAMNRDTLRALLVQMQLTYKAVRVDVVEEPRVAVEPASGDGEPTATVDMRADVFLGPSADQPPTDALVQQARGGNAFRLRLAKRDGEWMIVRLEPADRRP